MQFRLINTAYNNAYLNMAIDEALLTSKLPVLRFYGWKPAGLSIGYFQSINDFNLKNLKKHNVDLVRRLTGGNAVLHDKELTYSFIINGAEMPSSVIESYKIISKGLLQGLKNLGLKATTNKAVKEGKKSAVCFNDPSWYEILVNKKKIIGSAQKRVNGNLLQHGAILIGVDIEKYASLFNNCDEDLIKKIKQRMTSIKNELKKRVMYDQVKQAMKKGFEKALKIDFIEDKLSKEELKLAKKLESKYNSKKWNLKSL